MTISEFLPLFCQFPIGGSLYKLSIVVLVIRFNSSLNKTWLIFQHLETVIKSRIPGLQSLISKTISELEAELTRLGKPIANDAGVSILFYSLRFIF